MGPSHLLPMKISYLTDTYKALNPVKCVWQPTSQNKTREVSESWKSKWLKSCSSHRLSSGKSHLPSWTRLLEHSVKELASLMYCRSLGMKEVRREKGNQVRLSCPRLRKLNPNKSCKESRAQKVWIWGSQTSWSLRNKVEKTVLPEVINVLRIPNWDPVD